MKYCRFCGTALEDDCAFCDQCGNCLTTVEEEKTEASVKAPASPKKRKTKRIVITVAVVLSVLLVVTGIGLLTNWFGLISPMKGLIDATKNTLTSKSLTVRVRITDDDAMGRRFTEEEKLQLIFDRENEEFALYARGNRGIRAYYEGTSYVYTARRVRMYRDSGGEDFFDRVDKYVDEDNNINWKNVIRDARFEKYVDYSEIEDALEDFIKNDLCDKKWLESKLDFKKKGDVYTFEADAVDLYDLILEVCDDSDVFTKAGMDAVAGGLKRYGRELLEEDGSVKLSVTVKDKKISKVVLVLNFADSKRTIELKFSGYNKTKITEKEIVSLEDMIRAYRGY